MLLRKTYLRKEKKYTILIFGRFNYYGIYFFSANYKNKKLALIAIYNKLLKLVYGVVKTAVLCQANYCKKIA
jgi:hypothetical protein